MAFGRAFTDPPVDIFDLGPCRGSGNVAHWINPNRDRWELQIAKDFRQPIADLIDNGIFAADKAKHPARNDLEKVIGNREQQRRYQR